MPDLDSTMQWKVDVTQFTAAMQEAKKALSNTNSEFRLTTSTMDKWSTSSAGIEAKLKQLGGQLEANQRILDIYTNAWEEAKEEFGETSPEAERLAKQIENQQIKVNKAQVQIDKYTNQLNQMQAEQKESETATEKLNSTIEEQESKVAALKNEYKDAVLQYGKNSDQAKELAKQIEELSSELAENKKQMNNADKAADEFDRSLDDLDDSTVNVTDGFTVMKGVLANLVTQGINKVIEGVRNLARETFNAGATFESSMSNVAAISGATADEMDQLAAKAEEMGAKTKFSASESADAFSYMAMAGWKTEDMLNGIEGIMNLAAASGSDLATASDIVTDALTAMGYSAGDAGKLADVMAAASSNANTNVELMGATFKYAAPIVGALGYEMEDAAVAIGLMANAGIKGEQAGTALRSILTRLSAPPKECATAMDALGISLTDSKGNMKSMDEVIGDLRKAFDGLSETEQTAYAKNIAGQEAMSGLLAIVNAAPEDFNKLTLAVNNSTGAAERMANTMNDNVSGQITLLKSKIEGIMIKIFDKASGSIRKALDTVSNALDKVDWNKFATNAGKAAEKVADMFNFVIKHGQTIIDTLKAIAIAFVTYKAVSTITSVIDAFTKLQTAIKAGDTVMKALNMTMTASPVGLIAAAVVGLGSAVAIYAKKSHDAKMAQYELNEEQQAAIDDVAEMTARYNELAEARDASVEQINTEYEYLGGLKNQYNDLIDENGKVKKGYEDRANFILNQLAEAMGVEVDQVKKMIDENGKLGESIDEVIRKKQAEAVLMANEQLYNEAIQNRAGAFEKLTKAQQAVDEAEKKYQDTQKESEQFWNKYYELLEYSPEAAQAYWNANNSIIEANNTAKKSYEDASKELEGAEETWIGYNKTIQNYEGLSAAIISGDSVKIQEALQALQNGFITAENSNKESLEQQVKDYETNLANLQHAIETGTPYVTQEMVDQAQSMVDAAKKELDKLAPEASKEGKEGGQAYADGVGSKAGEAEAAGKKNKDAAEKGAKENGGMKTTGENTGDAYSKGVESKKSDAKSAGEELADKAVEGAKSENGDNGGAKTSGSNFGEGFFNGIGSWVSKVWNKGVELAKSALGGVKKGQQEGSPSKLTRQSGIYFGEGYALGISDMIKPVTDAASDMAKKAADALGESMNTQMNLIGIEGGNSLIDGINSVIPNMSESIGNLKNGVASVNAGINDSAASVGTFAAKGDKVQNVTFNQYNNSPKALSRLELYRETNSLLFSAKVRLSDV